MTSSVCGVAKLLLQQALDEQLRSQRHAKALLLQQQ
jgi:hypothetical protein